MSSTMITHKTRVTINSSRINCTFDLVIVANRNRDLMQHKFTDFPLNTG